MSGKSAMFKGSDKYRQILRHVVKTAIILDLIALTVSLFITNKTIEFLIGLVLGSVIASFKLSFTFRGIIEAIDQSKQIKKQVNTSVVNIFGYLLIILVLVVGAYIDTSAFVGVMTGIFSVYFGISLYNVYYGISSKRKKRNDDQ